MGKWRLTYKKSEPVKYLSHLDFIRMFSRAMKRAGILMSYSQGFNPHPIMTVGVPMSVGLTGENEYMEMKIENKMTAIELKNKLNKYLPIGYEITEVVDAEDLKPPISAINRAEYIITAYGQFDGFSQEILEGFLNQSEINVMRKTKSGEKMTDIKQMIYSVDILSMQEGKIVLRSEISCGNINLKPETLITAIKEFSHEFICDTILVHRLALKIVEK